MRVISTKVASKTKLLLYDPHKSGEKRAASFETNGDKERERERERERDERCKNGLIVSAWIYWIWLRTASSFHVCVPLPLFMTLVMNVGFLLAGA